MLTEIDQRVSKPEGTTFRQNVEKAEHYSNDEEYWQEQTAMTRGMTSIKDDEKLSDPEQHAKGTTKLKQKHDIDATTIANIQINGLGKYSAIQAEYEINIDFEERIGYKLEKSGDTARDNNKDIANQDLAYLENQLRGVLEKYNQEEETPMSPGWTYGESRAQALDD